MSSKHASFLLPLAALLTVLASSGCTETIENSDLCPDDPAKTEAMACGCGTSDADSNSNGAPDCFDTNIDLCPDDTAKIQAGTCGCGVSDADGNDNGIPDCLDADIDFCPDDTTKTQPGTCGCGTADADGNLNGVPDCLDAGIDLCPNDSTKTQAGTCGCGVSDADGNGNGVPGCLDGGIDLCPNDASKTQAGTCGCGVADADTNLNGVPDCLDAAIDLCPSDPTKNQAGACGCGSPDEDLDTNGVPDCFQATCGNGFRQPGEACDDGNTTSDAKCSANCQVSTYATTTTIANQQPFGIFASTDSVVAIQAGATIMCDDTGSSCVAVRVAGQAVTLRFLGGSTMGTLSWSGGTGGVHIFNVCGGSFSPQYGSNANGSGTAIFNFFGTLLSANRPTGVGIIGTTRVTGTLADGTTLDYTIVASGTYRVNFGSGVDSDGDSIPNGCDE